jgi:uncharacterized protein YjgD (DUF1641 family)
MASKKQDHKKRLQARKTRLLQEKNKSQKNQKEFIMNLIKQEQQKGLFDSNQTIGGGDNTIIEGPSF